MLTWAPFNNNNNSTTYTRKEASKLTNAEKEERKLKLMSQLSLWATRWHTSFVNFLSTYAIFDYIVLHRKVRETSQNTYFATKQHKFYIYVERFINQKNLHMTDIFSTDIIVVLVSNMRYV